MKVLLYCRRNVGLYCLSHLVALGHEVSVMTDDENVAWLSDRYGCHVIENGDWAAMPVYELLVCIHGNKIIPKKYMTRWMINLHPCLTTRPGHNPIKGYIQDKGRAGSVSSQWMIEEVDKGGIIHTEWFDTPECQSYADFYNVALPFYIKCLDMTLNKIL